jgi:hypothetical protein
MSAWEVTETSTAGELERPFVNGEISDHELKGFVSAADECAVLECLIRHSKPLPPIFDGRVLR